MTIRKKTSEELARFWCNKIENYSIMALSPQPNSYENDSPENPTNKKKRNKEPPAAGTRETEDVVQLEKQFEITGTRVIMPEDRGVLESAAKLLRAAFDALTEHMETSASSSENLDSLFQKLGELIAASYYIGAYTTVSLGVQKFVAPAVLREQAKTPQRAKAVKDVEKRQRLRSAIKRAAGRGELKASRAFANLIYDKVFAEVGILDKEGKKKWPSRKTIKNEIELMREEGVAK
jgi:hypothetical protein